MAIARGAGTEIIGSIHLQEVEVNARPLIFGVKHHIYTVLSVICFSKAIQADGNWITMYLQGYDAYAGTTDESIYIFKQDMSLNQTYVWNDKFSFNGTEPTDFAGPTDDATKQNAIADQGSAVSQRLIMSTENAADAGHVTVTYIDQNNA